MAIDPSPAAPRPAPSSMRRATRAAGAVLALIALTACGGRSDRAPVVYRGSAPGTAVGAGGADLRASPGVAAPAAPVEVAALPAPGTSVGGAGVVDYGGYRAVIAQTGDTVDTMAARAGISGAALAAYNGLPAGHVPRPGDELILPPDAPATAAAPAVTAVAAAPTLEPAVSPAPPPARATGFDLDRIEAAIAEPAPVEPPPGPETAAAPEPAPVEPPAQTAVAAIEPAPAPAPAPAPTPAASSSGRFLPPVDGPISRPYNRAAGAGRNDGVDFSAPAGAPVRAAAPGQVALVSESLGGLGTIVLIRHGDDLLTVYGRVDGVSVKRGDQVAAGDVIGEVAPAPDGGDPALHFEVRRGADSVDPADYL